MDQVIARVKGNSKKQYFKLISDQQLFDTVAVNLSSCVPYNPDHNLDEDSWFKIEAFSQYDFCIDFLKEEFDSKDYDDLSKSDFPRITHLVAVQGEDFYFQKITPSLYVRRKTLVFGEIAEIEQSQTRLVINAQPDAIYFKSSDVLIFRSLATISSIFKGIDQLYKEATNQEVESFLSEPFIRLGNNYDAKNVSKPNRRRIGLAMATLETMSDDDRKTMLCYIHDYSSTKNLVFDEQNQQFEVLNDEGLKLLLYGIEQRFYTTHLSQERRLANSVRSIE